MSAKYSFFAVLQGGLLALYSWVVYRTSKVTIEGWENVETASESDRPIIFVNWHGQIHLAYCVFTSRIQLEDVLLVIVGDWRQGLLDSFAKYAGAEAFPVDMGDNSMAAARSLLALIKKLTPGKYSYFSPDGPDGPARVAKPGIAFIAERAEALIVPIGNHARHAFYIRRWDRYTLPLPFTHIFTVIGSPIEATRGAPREAVLEQLTDALNQADERALALTSANK
jgi:lysophospholipid acyltransferase (LPLAT)-like uncharacterized protein